MQRLERETALLHNYSFFIFSLWRPSKAVKNSNRKSRGRSRFGVRGLVTALLDADLSASRRVTNARLRGYVDAKWLVAT